MKSGEAVFIPPFLSPILALTVPRIEKSKVVGTGQDPCAGKSRQGIHACGKLGKPSMIAADWTAVGKITTGFGVTNRQKRWLICRLVCILSKITPRSSVQMSSLRADTSWLSHWDISPSSELSATLFPHHFGGSMPCIWIATKITSVPSARPESRAADKR